MPGFTRKFPLVSDGPDRLEITWQGSFFYPASDIHVYLDGQPVGQFIDRADLRRGKTFLLPEGAPLTVQLQGNSLLAFIGEQSLNDLEHPRKELRQSAQLFLYMSGLNLLLLVSGWLFDRESMTTSPWLLAGVVLAAGLYGLFYWLARRGNFISFLLGGLLAVPNAILMAYTLNAGSIGLLLVSLVVAIRSLGAARTAFELAKKDL